MPCRPERGRPWLPPGVVSLLYIGVTLLLFARTTFGGGRFFGRDLMHYFLPLAATLRAAWQAGDSLLWDPSIFHGLPMIARWSAALFYPPHWLLFFLPGGPTLTWILALHLPLAASGMERLARRYVNDCRASALTGLAFGFSGYLVSMLGGVTYLYGAALLPWSLLAVHRLAERPQWPRIVQLACIWALQVYVADPETLYFEVLVVAPLILLTVAIPTHQRAQAVLGAAAAGVLAAGLSFCQLWPTMELAGLSTRADGFAFDAAQVWSLHPLRFFEIPVPGLFGVIGTENGFWARGLISAPFNVPWAAGLYIGVVSLAGLAFLYPARHRLDVRLWVGISLLFALLALGLHTPVYELMLSVVPGATRFRYPEKLMLFATVGVTLLGSIGLERLFGTLDGGDADRPHRPVAMTLAGLGIVLGLMALLLAKGWLVPADLLIGALAGTAARSPVAPDALAGTVSSLLRAAAMTGVVSGILVVGRRLRPWLLGPILFTTLAVDLLSAGWPLVQLTTEAWPDEPPAACAFLPPADAGSPLFIYRSPRLQYTETSGSTDLGSRFERQRRWQQQTLTPNTAAPGCGRYVTGYDAVKLRNWQRFEETVGRDADRFLDLLGARAIVGGLGEINPRVFPLHTKVANLGIWIHANDGLPYTLAVANVETVPDLEASLNRLVDSSFNYRSTVIFETPEPLPDEAQAPRQVTIAFHRPGDVALTTSFAAPGYLLLQENHYPGWRAAIDEAPVRLYRANALFLGLPIPQGEHRVRLTFAPDRQKAGNRVSLVCWLLVVVYAVIAIVRGRRGRS